MNRPTWKILQGDARKLDLPDASVNMCVTSPPYWGLRDYGHEGQLGLEPTPEQYVANMVEVFREVKRVLRDDGTLWLNIGDSYASQGGAHGGRDDNQTGVGAKRTHAAGGGDQAQRSPPTGLKHKDLVGIPWMLAFALRADGWYLRQDIIWHKPNPMPESVRDRCTKAHEYLFLLSKSERYYYDVDAIRQPAAEGSKGKNWIERQAMGFRGDSKHPTKDAIEAGLHIPSFAPNAGGVNRRSVWTVNTQPYRGAHFATFPPALIEPCILAGCPAGGTVLDPFGGSGTTAEVALKHGRNVVLNELNPEYIALAEERIANATKQATLFF